MGLRLRPYQDNAIARVFELFESGRRRVLLVLPTGGGKTVVASEIVRRCLDMAKRSIFLAHRRELIANTHVKLLRNGLPVEGVGVIMAGTPGATLPLRPVPLEAMTDDEVWTVYGRRRPSAAVQVGSIDTFRNRIKPPSELVIVDEAHRALAKSYRDVQSDYPDAWHLGLTATPMRGDGKGLEDAYDEIVIVATFEELVADGFLIAPTCYGTPKKADLSGVRTSGGDYNQEDLARAVDKAELVGDIVEHWQKYGNNAATFAFACNVAHSKHLAERFNAAGIPARHVDGETDTAERDSAVRDLRDGRVKVLTNCGIFCEGTDVPIVKTIILARPTKSEGLYLQQAGRGARPCEGAPPFIILDHAQCVSTFGPPQMYRPYTLEGSKAKKPAAGALPPTKDCPECFAIVARNTKACPCGFVFPIEVAPVEPPAEKAGELVDITELSRAQVGRLKEWTELVAEWHRENDALDSKDEPLLPGSWVVGQWRRRMRDWPPKGSKVPKLTAEQEARSNARRAAGKRRPEEPIKPRPIQVSAMPSPRGATALERWEL